MAMARWFYHLQNWTFQESMIRDVRE